jgi:hypothetical protein
LARTGLRTTYAESWIAYASVSDERRLEGSGEQVPVSAVPPVELVRPATEEALHPFAEVRLWCLDYKMNVRIHQAIRVNTPAVALRNPRERRDERAPILVILHDPDACVPACDHMLNRARRLESGLARHEVRVAKGSPRR